MKICCPECNKIQTVSIKSLFRQRCEYCNIRIPLKYSTKVKVGRWFSHTLILFYIYLGLSFRIYSMNNRVIETIIVLLTSFILNLIVEVLSLISLRK